MTDHPHSGLRERARRALERSLQPVTPPPGEPPDAELLARLEAALRSLPRRRREIFLAVRLNVVPYSEIAQRTGLSIKRVEREIARAIAQIDRCLAQREVSPSYSWWRRFRRR